MKIPKYIEPFAKIVAVALVVSLNGAGILAVGDTLGFYLDVESSTENVFIAGNVDFAALDAEWDPLEVAVNMAPGDVTEKSIEIDPLSSNPFQYFVDGTTTGDASFCAGIDADLSQESGELYSGSLDALLTTATTSTTTLTLSATTGLNNFQNMVCNVSLEFNGWQTRHTLPSMTGYNDTEVVTTKLASWGFRINKVYYDVASGDDIEPQQCNAKSKGYWKNNEGCSGGSGTSPWSVQVSALSDGFSDVFNGVSGAGVCTITGSSCSTGSSYDKKLCQAKQHTIANELNVVSGKLDLDAVIAGADDGDSSFDALGLSPLSTIGTALAAVEAVIADGTSTTGELEDAAYVAQRLYDFYENENPDAPMCLYNESGSDNRGEEGTNEWVEIYNQTNVDLDISGWQICDNTLCDTIPDGTPEVPAMGYAVITNDPDTFSSTGIAPWYLPAGVVYIPLNENIGNGLSNDADMLMLKRPDGVIVDQMNYGTLDTGWTNYNANVWNPGATDVAEGNLLARVPSGYDTDQASDWVEIAPPSVDLIYPDENGSYMWYWGYSYAITWSATNPNGDNADLNMSLFYIKDLDHSGHINDADSTHTIALTTANDGAFNWAVPSGFIGYIWIKLVATGPENSLNNSRTVSGSIYDPIPLFVGPEGVEPEDLDDIDTEAPVITLSGNNPAVVEMGATYSDLGALVTDNVNQNLGYTMEGEVDTTIPGEYTLTYSAVDQAGNMGTAARIVIVYDPANGLPDLSAYQTELEEVVPEATETGSAGGGSEEVSQEDEQTAREEDVLPEAPVEEAVPQDEEVIPAEEPVLEEIAVVEAEEIPAEEESGAEEVAPEAEEEIIPFREEDDSEGNAVVEENQTIENQETVETPEEAVEEEVPPAIDSETPDEVTL